jgi:DnaJ-class molecular chaperone
MFRRTQRCRACHGRRFAPCPRCEATGTLIISRFVNGRHSTGPTECPDCHGQGRLVCMRCRGTGEEPVSVPRGMRDLPK